MDRQAMEHQIAEDLDCLKEFSTDAQATVLQFEQDLAALQQRAGDIESLSDEDLATLGDYTRRFLLVAPAIFDGLCFFFPLSHGKLRTQASLKKAV